MLYTLYKSGTKAKGSSRVTKNKKVTLLIVIAARLLYDNSAKIVTKLNGIYNEKV